jgi:hypothetical protein
MAGIIGHADTTLLTLHMVKFPTLSIEIFASFFMFALTKYIHIELRIAGG